MQMLHCLEEATTLQLCEDGSSRSLLISNQPLIPWVSSCPTNRVGSVAGQVGLSWNHKCLRKFCRFGTLSWATDTPICDLSARSCLHLSYYPPEGSSPAGLGSASPGVERVPSVCLHQANL